MDSGIDIDYSITSDYSKLNPPSFVKILDLYNTIIIPVSLLDSFNINVGDSIQIIDHNNKDYKITQKVILEHGMVSLGFQDYYYFYIGNGISVSDTNSKYSLIFNNHTFPLSLRFDNPDTVKLIMGLLVLPDNYSHTIYREQNHIINIDGKDYKIYVDDYINKLNYFVANKITSLIKVLSPTNYRALQHLNNSNNNISKYIRPLCNSNFPLGSVKLNITNKGVLYPIEYQVCVNNNKYLVNSNTITIQNLEAGQYTIRIIDRNGSLSIHQINNQILDKEIFDITIPQVEYTTDYRIGTLPVLYKKSQPINGLANIMINLSYNDPVEIFGPNNFYHKSNIGYFGINNINGGNYTIKQNNTIKDFMIFTNDTTYINGLT